MKAQVIAAATACLLTAGCTVADQANSFVAGMPTPYQEVSVPADARAKLDAAIVRQLREPDSAQLRDLRAAQGVVEEGAQATIICGYINGRNGFGGFTGYQPMFFETIGGNAGTLDIDDPGIYALCQAAGIPI